MNRKRFVPLLVLCVLLSFITILSLTGAVWTLSQFANPTMDEIVFELTAPLKGTGNSMIRDFILRCVLPAVVGSVTIVIATYFLYRKKSSLFKRWMVGLCSAEAAVFVSVFLFFSFKVDFWKYLRNQFEDSDFIERYYVDPDKTDITFPADKRNLIMIYLESMESTFTDQIHGGAFDTDYIPELTKLAIENEDFSGNDSTLNGGYSMPGTTWTIAGMFATTTGLPLNVALYDNSLSSQETFFPGIVSLGDILREQGYRQVLMLGSDAEFGGRKLYYTEHGAYEQRDYNYAVDNGLIPPDYKVFWGFEDKKLFGFSKELLTELSASDQPFALTMLTVDTHMPEGYECDLCEDKYDLQYANVLSCSSKQTYEFIEWIKQQDFFENTTIVITGDHPTMAKNICDNVSSNYIRKTYTCIINADSENMQKSTERSFTTFDIYPTTLAAIGAKIKGNRLGLGTNLFSEIKTISEEIGYQKEAEEVSKRSIFLDNLEKLDHDVQVIIDKLADYNDYSVSYEKDGNCLLIRVEDNFEEKYNVKIKLVRAKVWYFNSNSVEVHKTVKLKKDENGAWTRRIKMKKFDGADSVHFQLFVKPVNYGSMSLGPEGEIDLS